MESVLEYLLKPVEAATNLVDGGGIYVFFIFMCGVVMWTLLLERFWYFKRVLPGEARQMIETWNGRRDHLSWRARQIRQTMISRLNLSMTANFPLMRALVPLSPLLGL